MYSNEFEPAFHPSDEEVQQMEAAGLEDNSWHNDTCPSWRNPDNEVQLYIDAVNPEEREYDKGSRISVLDIDQGDTLYNGNSLEEAITVAKRDLIVLPTQVCEDCGSPTKMSLDEAQSTEGGWECGDCGETWNVKHNCFDYAVPYTDSGGALGHGFECGLCGDMIQAG